MVWEEKWKPIKELGRSLIDAGVLIQTKEEIYTNGVVGRKYFVKRVIV